MDVRIAVPDRHVSEGVLNAGLEMNTRVNEALIREGSSPTFTQAIQKGVRWAPEPPGQESFDHGAKVASRGWGDCDDLAPLRAASLRVSGKDPEATAVVYKSGPGRWHAIVQRGDGSLEDPSRTAGMKVREGSTASGIPPAVVGCMGAQVVGGAVRPFVAVRRDEGGYLARVDVPIDSPGEAANLSIVQRGRSPSHALAGCTAGACLVGGVSGMVEEETLGHLWALSGLMKGQTLAEVAGVCGAEAAKDALLTLKEIAPDLVDELRRHWDDARTLREDFDRRRARKASKAAVPMAVSGHRHHRHHRHHVHGGLEDPGPGPGATRMGPAEWSEHLAHERPVSPYAERFGARGRQFVGGAAVGTATDSPYLEMVRQRRTWGNPRAFGSEQAFDQFRPPPVAELGSVFDNVSALGREVHAMAENSPGANFWGAVAPDWSHLGHDRVVSPFAERFGHRGRQFVGAHVAEELAGVGFVPHLSFSLSGAHPGAHHHPHHGGHHRSPARRIVGEANLAESLDRALHAPPIVGWDLFQDVIKPAGDTLSHIISKPAEAITNIHPPGGFNIDLGKTVSDIGKGLDTIGHVASDALKAAQGVISLIPGIGTGISAAISAGLALLSGGSPLEIAVKMAYGAIPIPPGVRNVTDMVVDAALSLQHVSNFTDAAIATVRKATIDRLPGFAQGIGGTVFDTLAHLVLGHSTGQSTTAAVVKPPVGPMLKGIATKTVTVPQTAGHFAALAAGAAIAAAKVKPPPPKPPPRKVVLSPKAAAGLKAIAAAAPKKPAPPPPKPAIVPIAATHTTPPPAALLPPPQPISLAVISRTMLPQIIRHHVAVPKGVTA